MALPTLGSRRVRRTIYLGFGAALVAWGAFAAFRVVAAAHADRLGEREASAAMSRLDLSSLETGHPAPQLAAAAREFRRAANLLGSPWVRPLDIVPFAGRQLRSVRTLSSTAATVASVGGTSAREVAGVVGGTYATPAARLAALQQLAAISTGAERGISHLDFGPAHGLIGSLASRRTKLMSDVAKANTALHNAAVGSSLAVRLLGGNTRYLLLETNNAEMRAGSGMILRISLLTAENGVVRVGPTTVDASHLVLPGNGVPVQGDLAARWGWLQPGRDYRNLFTTPQFDATASLAASMWEATQHQTVDGAIALDDVSMQYLLRATGPLLVAGQKFDSSNVLQYLVEGQYAQPDRAARVDTLDQISQAAVDAINKGRVKLTALGNGMSGAVLGRHIMLWSPDTATESSFEVLGVAGAVAPGDVAVSVLNTGGNKLDPYLIVHDDATFASTSSGTEMTLHVTVRSTASGALPAYVTGAVQGPIYPVGDYAGLLDVNLPSDASGVRVVGHPVLAAAGPDGPVQVAALPFLLPAGHDSTFVITCLLPRRHGSIRILPSARVPEAQWSVGGRSFIDDRPHQVNF